MTESLNSLTSYGIGGGAILWGITVADITTAGGVLLLTIRVLYDGTRLYRYWFKGDKHDKDK